MDLPRRSQHRNVSDPTVLFADLSLLLVFCTVAVVALRSKGICPDRLQRRFRRFCFVGARCRVRSSANPRELSWPRRESGTIRMLRNRPEECADSERSSTLHDRMPNALLQIPEVSDQVVRGAIGVLCSHVNLRLEISKCGSRCSLFCPANHSLTQSAFDIAWQPYESTWGKTHATDCQSSMAHWRLPYSKQRCCSHCCQRSRQYNRKSVRLERLYLRRRSG